MRGGGEKGEGKGRKKKGRGSSGQGGGRAAGRNDGKFIATRKSWIRPWLGVNQY